MSNSMSTKDAIMRQLKGALIVSCQAGEDEPLHGAQMMAAMARAAVQGGARGIRANGPADIRAIREVVSAPIVGIYKRDYPDSPVRITPTPDEARALAEAGCEIIALDGTARPRPRGIPLEAIIALIHRDYGRLVMADISTFEEGVEAARLGADFVATTLSGYTPYSRQQTAPDFELIRELTAALDAPVVAEGRITTPDDARRALEMGAFAVTVGSMITRPHLITAYFVKRMAAGSSY